MAWSLERTCWQGLQVDHPPDWELVRVSGPGEPGQCLFADRHFQRLEVRWQVLGFAPRLELLIDKYRKADSKAGRSEPLEGHLAEWRGLVRHTPRGSVLQAARTIPQQRLLVEATIVWPEKREVELERAILSSIAAMPRGPTQSWQAMGLSATVPGELDLRSLSAKVGRVRWEFSAGGRPLPRIAVERLAMPEYWLKGPLRDWLVQEVPSGHKVLCQDLAPWNNHRAERLITRSWAGTLAALRGRRQMRLDLAWQCQIENRVYHLEFAQLSAEPDIALPELLAVRCCRQASATANLPPGQDEAGRAETVARTNEGC